MKYFFALFLLVVIIFSACSLSIDTLQSVEGSDYEGLKEWPINFSEAILATWEDDKLAAFSITIDDNHGQDVEWWIEQGEIFNIPFTWFLIPKIVKSTVNNTPSGYWELYQRAFNAGHDIQSHTYSHNYDADIGNLSIEQEYSIAISMIEQNISGAKVETLAYPGGYQPTDISEKDNPDLAMEYYIGARGVVNNINQKQFNYQNCLAISQTANILNPSRQWEYAPRLFDPEDESFRGFFCMYYHDVFYQDEIGKKKAALAVLDFCNSRKNDLWVTTFRNVIKYARERDNVETVSGYLPSEVKDNSIIISLSTQGRLDKRFNYPLSIKIKVNADWQSAIASQGDTQIPSKVILYNEEYYLLIQAVPDSGVISISLK